MTDHEIYIRSHWHNDSTSGLTVGCSCGEDLLDDDREEISLKDAESLRWLHDYMLRGRPDGRMVKNDT